MERDDTLLDARPAALPEILPLRHRVLRPGQPRANAHFEGDDLPQTVHWGLFDLARGECLACLSILRQPLDGDDAWQLRGMAVTQRLRGIGLGTRLLKAVLDDLRARCHAPGQAPDLLWCNARKNAVPFYAAAGFRPDGPAFDIPGIGPHLRMRRPIVPRNLT